MTTAQEAPLLGVCLLSVNEKAEVHFARDLAAVLDLPMFVYPGGTKLPALGRTSEELQSLQRTRLQSAIPGIQIAEHIVGETGLVVVSNSLAQKEASGRARSGLIMLAAHDEHRFNPHKKTKILVPFGRETTALKALKPALFVAKKLDATIVLYHTTRPKASCTSKDWRDHMVEGARETLRQALELCQVAGVKVELEITSVFPQLIAEGIANAALDHDCFMIIMAVASDVVFGSHSLQILDFSTIPTLIMA